MRLVKLSCTAVTLKFQSTHSRGVRRRLQTVTAWADTDFNPRTHEECDPGTWWSINAYGRFQSTHSRGVRPGLQQAIHASVVFQSTHSRGVRLGVGIGVLQADDPISIHALTRSATRTDYAVGYMTRNFNPRTHEECDNRSWLHGQVYQNFNPRTHEECDNSNQRGYGQKTEFQSTHSRGVRPCNAKRSATTCSDFNPRTHEECDQYIDKKRRHKHYFNPRTHEECDGEL